MPGHDIVVIGGSAGAVQAVQDIARALPADFPAAVLVVIHTSPTSPGVLSRIIDHASPLAAAYATDDEPIRRGRIYVAPPDHHLLVLDDRVRVSRGPKENGFRPAVDPLFRTAVASYGPRVAGVVLSGGLDDGTLGMSLIHRAGGATLVQDPIDAAFPEMPRSVIQNVPVDHVLPVAGIPGVLIELAKEPAPPKGGHMGRPTASRRNDIAFHGDRALRNGTTHGPPSALTCPECGGALWERAEGNLVHYQCHVGHAYTADGLVAAQAQDLEAALWSALRALEENAELRRRMAQRARDGNLAGIAQAYEKQASTAERQADAIRAVLTDERGNGAFALPPTELNGTSVPKKHPPRRKNASPPRRAKSPPAPRAGTTSKNRGKAAH